ncbi:MAG: FkbM family methyltransferase [Gemmatimonadetes bacterium]|nr:FkbM family methyltransferase [Gemmatimonadota bacterium]
MRSKAVLASLTRSRPLRMGYEAAARLPLLGPMARSLARRALPYDARLWFEVAAGPAQGLWLRLNPRYETDYCDGAYEARLQAFLGDALRPGDVVYDVGAHIGFFSLLCARLVGASGRVLALEADPENAARLREHAERNRLRQIEVLEAAAWSAAGRLRFVRSQARSSRNTGAVLGRGDGPGGEEVVEVRAVCLNDLLPGGPEPRLLKIDVEGAETDVLRGATMLLASARPLILCEVHTPENLEAVARLLRGFGYTLRVLNPGNPAFPAHYEGRP